MKDPTNAILKAYVDVLKGAITHNGNVVWVGTGVPQDKTEWVYIYIESMDNMSPGDNYLVEALVALQVVSMQDILESDDTVVNDIFEQVLRLTENPDAFQMNGFNLVDLRPINFDRDEENTEANHIITRKIQISNYVEQI